MKPNTAIHQSQRYGDLRVSYRYVETDREVGEEPAMVLSRVNHKTVRDCVIPLSVASKMADSRSGGPTQLLVRASIMIAEQMGYLVDRHTAHRIASAIVDEIPELVKMPPKPQMTKKSLERKMELDGLKMCVNGETVIDAT